jgi:FMN phosphatase YigB (HAD superfamily)
VLDLGGVLIKINFNHAFAYWSERSDVAPELISRAFCFDAEFKAYEVNRISTVRYLAHLRCVLSLPTLGDRELVAGWNRIFEEVDTQVIAAIQTLRESGLLVIGMTNTNPLHEPIWRKIVGDRLSVFDAVHTSVELGLRKPTLEFFEWVCRNYSLSAEELLFVDDQWIENVVPARAIGITTIHYAGISNFLQEISAAGWPVEIDAC